MKWLCCQIGAREHYAVPRGLLRHDALEMLVTDAWCVPTSALAHIHAPLRARYHEELRSVRVASDNVRAIAFELGQKLRSASAWERFIRRNIWFEKRAVAHLSDMAHGNDRVLMAYSYAALDIFRFARVRGWRTVLGQIDPGPAEERVVGSLAMRHPKIGEWQPAPAGYWKKWRQECLLADRIVVNSEWSKQGLLQEGICDQKIKIIPLAYERPIEAERFERRVPPGFSSKRPLRVLFLGQVNQRKGVVEMLEAIELLGGHPIEFTIVGPMQLAPPANLMRNARVRWIGPVDRRDTSQFYREADIFLFPTFSDGFGLTQLEAQAWQLPIIASQFCGRVVQHGVNGWILNKVTGEEIATTLLQCLQEPKALQEFARKQPMKKYNLNEVGKSWMRLFD